MEIRKFIIELHPDGKMTWCEFEEQRDYIPGMSAKKFQEAVLKARQDVIGKVVSCHLLESDYGKGICEGAKYMEQNLKYLY
jgi:hypothetical protein